MPAWCPPKKILFPNARNFFLISCANLYFFKIFLNIALYYALCYWIKIFCAWIPANLLDFSLKKYFQLYLARLMPARKNDCPIAARTFFGQPVLFTSGIGRASGCPTGRAARSALVCKITYIKNGLMSFSHFKRIKRNSVHKLHSIHTTIYPI